MNNITDTQIKIIHIAIHQLKIDDDTYRDLLTSNYNVSSSKLLTFKQATHLIADLKSKGFKQKKKKTTVSMGGKIIKLLSPYQAALIDVLKSNIAWRSDDGFNLWLSKRMKTNKIITTVDAAKVIEGLKGMLGIKSEIIFKQLLPFPYEADKVTVNNNEKIVWYFDTTTQKLVGYSVANNGAIRCLTKK